MKQWMTRRVVVGGAIALGLVCGLAGSASTGESFRKKYPANESEFDRMFDELKNWGRWGNDDRLGTINLITDAKRKQASQLVRNGISVSLSHDLMKDEAPDNRNSFQQALGGNFQADTYTFRYHGEATTHIDALCHQSQKQMMYNGVPSSASNAKGCAIGIEHLKNGIVTRGVLIDMPRLKDVPYLEPPTPVYPEDVEAWEKKVGIKITAGDAIFLRTGRWTRRAKLGPWNSYWNNSGFHPSIGPWLKARDVAVVGAEATAEAKTDAPYLTEGVSMPLHVFLVAGLGMPIIDNVDLDAVAETAARLRRWEFMVVIAPLSVPGGTGGPVNVVGIF